MNDLQSAAGACVPKFLKGVAPGIFAYLIENRNPLTHACGVWAEMKVSTRSQAVVAASGNSAARRSKKPCGAPGQIKTSRENHSSRLASSKTQSLHCAHINHGYRLVTS